MFDPYIDKNQLVSDSEDEDEKNDELKNLMPYRGMNSDKLYNWIDNCHKYMGQERYKSDILIDKIELLK